jgi:hypothetical protein
LIAVILKSQNFSSYLVAKATSKVGIKSGITLLIVVVMAALAYPKYKKYLKN